MFFTPPAGGPRGRAAGASTREKVQLAVMVAVLLAIFGWWGTQRSKRAAQRAPEEPYQIIDVAEEERRSRVTREDVIRLKAEEEGKTGVDKEEPEDSKEADPGFGHWRARTPEEIPPEDKKWRLEADRADEAKRAQFLPMLDEFKPLEPDAVYAYRTRIMNRVPTLAQASFTLPGEPGVRYTVQKADGEGLTARRADGPERSLTWEEIPVESLYEMAKQIAVTEGPRASVKDAFFLAQLAMLAGKADEAVLYRKSTVELDPELDGRIPSEPATSLDYEILDIYSQVWDDPMKPMPREASSVRGDAPSVFHVYRYLRTLGPDGLARVAEPPTRYELLQGLPVNYRSRVYTIKGRFIKRYKSTRWTGIDGHEVAGIQDLDFCFVRGAKWSGIYLVSVPKDTRVFSSSDMVVFTGVYIRRWPYLSQGQWKWIPWIAALDATKVEIGGSPGIRILGITLLAVTIVGVIAVFLYARRESRQAAVARERRVVRQRAQRDRIRRRAAEARPVGTSGRPDNAASKGEAGSAKGADEKGADEEPDVNKTAKKADESSKSGDADGEPDSEGMPG